MGDTIFRILIISWSYLVDIFLIAAMPQFYIQLVCSIGQLKISMYFWATFEGTFLNFLCPNSKISKVVGWAQRGTGSSDMDAGKWVVLAFSYLRILFPFLFSSFNSIMFLFYFLTGRKRNYDSASPSPPRPSKNELKNIRITIGDISNNSKKSKKFSLLSPRTVEPNYKGYWSQVFFF